MNRRQLLLRAQSDRGPRLGDPPAHLEAAERQAWRDIVAAHPACVLRVSDSIAVESAARLLAAWRTGDAGRPYLRSLYRWLGTMLMPMAARRRLLFPDAPPSRSRRV